MKRIISSLLIISLFLCLCGCSAGDTDNTVTLYYVRNSYVYGSADGVMAAEERTVTEPSSDEEILRSYLDGPVDDSLSSPFPYGSQILDLHCEEEKLYITLSVHIVTLPKAKQVLACACLARTAIELMGVDSVHFQTDSTDFARMEPIVINKDSVMLYDDYNSPNPTEPD